MNHHPVAEQWRAANFNLPINKRRRNAQGSGKLNWSSLLNSQGKWKPLFGLRKKPKEVLHSKFHPISYSCISRPLLSLSLGYPVIASPMCGPQIQFSSLVGLGLQGNGGRYMELLCFLAFLSRETKLSSCLLGKGIKKTLLTVYGFVLLERDNGAMTPHIWGHKKERK